MRRNVLVPAIVLGCLILAAVASAQSVASADILRATVTVDAIDKAQRVLTVRDEHGAKDTFRAPADMKRFDELKVGDRINLTYYMAKAFEVRKRDSSEPAPKAVGTSGTAIARSDGPLPGAAITEQRTETVWVKATDLNNALLTVVLPNGRIIKHKVQDPSLMKGIVADDRIDITYAEGLLVEVERP